MNQFHLNKKKIINDPVFGFINLQSELVFDLLESPEFQRLRRIKQLGLTYLVFPGANHSRFEHALGASHLMRQAISVLRLKGHKITNQEAEAVTVAILLHDIGHAPFSHVLENTLVEISHEEISLLIMNDLNRQFNGKLDLAIEIFTNQYEKTFLHQLVSSQLDMDRLDYLTRDSFFTGVNEGIVGIDRIIKMLNVWNGQLVVDAKGIYSIEKFLIARRLMYWQVYLHKTVVAAEFLLINVLKRASELVANGITVFATPALDLFLKNNFTSEDFNKNIVVDGKNVLEWFSLLDDNDILISVKEWQFHTDLVLSLLAKSIVNRKLFKNELKSKPVSKQVENNILKQISKNITHDEKLAKYLLITGDITNNALNKHNENIHILFNDGNVKDIRNASDINLSVLTKTVRKYILCYPKELDFY
ncbi:MAG: HD domain-containing protein [Prolixibacteraceae bacterium]|nr:HD domain-containing protein [Prolixibacteraceae bacterium]MBT6004396.1 HD domain-containing protein [Prolixibacteraceae bacterium]MBT6763001.1 HD domain-containing protein [Prolixibacteraceae bacterium]MBT6997502.1 HD domain-containing protein [Prolixibacteraceae bacterium]MBT7394604.1 HD domain-containing protein [Prolixibacteraceae bacterium]